MIIMMIIVMDVQKIREENSLILLSAKITCQEISFHLFNVRNYCTLSRTFSAKRSFGIKLISMGSKIYKHIKVHQMTHWLDQVSTIEILEQDAKYVQS